MSYSSDVLALSPLAYWRLGDSSGTTLADSSGNARDGSYTGTVTKGVAGIAGAGTDTAVTFPGTNGNYASVANAAWMSRTTDLGIGIWFKTTSTGNGYMMQKWSGVGGWGLDMQSSNVFRGYMRIGGTNRILSATVSGKRDGNWHFLFCNYTGTTIKLYLDGTEIATGSFTGAIGYSADDIFIGRRDAVTTDYFTGTLDEAMVGPAITPTQIANLYTSGITSSLATGVVDGSLPSPLTSSIPGTVTDSGVVAGTLPSPLTSSIPGTVTDAGAVDATLPGLTASFTETPRSEGIIGATLPGVTAAIAGTETITGSVGATLPGITSESAGTETGTGSVAATLPSLEAAIDGTVEEDDTIRGHTTGRNRAAGTRYRTGSGEWQVEVPVTPEPDVIVNPVSTITSPVEIYADTIPVLTQSNGIVEAVEATEVDGEWGRFRIRIANNDVTFFRGIPSAVVDYQLTDPYGWGPGTVAIPSVYFMEVDDFGEDGELRWLRKGAPVDFDQVVDGEVVSGVYHGIVDAINCADDGTVSLELSGALSGVLTQRWRPQRLVRGTGDIAFLLSVAVEGQVARSYNKAPGWYTNAHDGRVGLVVENFDGGMTYLSYVDKTLSEAITAAGQSWTILPTDNYREVDLVERDLDTVAATIYYGARGVSAPLVDDVAEAYNRFYGEGVDSDGSRWRNAFYPQTTAALNDADELVLPDYPFNDNRSFGLGTTNDDTDTGDGIRVLQNELIGSGVGFRLLDRGNEYNQATVDAVSTFQRNAGLTVTGNINPATWNLLMGDVESESLGQAIIRPLVFDPRTERHLYNQNGSVIGLNPLHDRSVPPIEKYVNFGTGWSKERATRWCLREYQRAQRAKWRGTITLTADVIEGEHEFGDPATAMSRLDLRAGMNVRVRGFGSGNGVVMHIASIQVSIGDEGPQVSLSVDCQGRPAVEVAQVLQRDAESNHDLARRAFLEHTRGSIQSDALVGSSKEDGFGVVRATAVPAQTWTRIQVIGGQSGTLQAVRLYTSDSLSEFACLVTARDVSLARLERAVPNPLVALDDDALGSELWTTSELATDLFDEKWGLFLAGTSQQPCGYSPRVKFKANGGATGAPLTGALEDEAGVRYYTMSTRAPWLYLYVWAEEACTIEGELVLQIIEGS